MRFSFCVILLVTFIINASNAQDDFDDGLGMYPDDANDMDGYPDPYGGDSYGGGSYDPYGGPGYGEDGYGGGAPSTPPRELESVDEITNFIGEDETEPSVIGYFSADNEEEKNIFVELATEMGMSFRFGYTMSDVVMKDMKYGSSAVILHRAKSFVDSKYEKPKARYAAKTVSQDSLRTFLEDKWFPLVGQVSHKNQHQYESQPTFMLFSRADPIDDAKLHRYYASRMRKVASSLPKGSALKFAIANPDQVNMDAYADAVHMDRHSDAAALIREGASLYLREGKFGTDWLREMVSEFQAGNIEPQEVAQPSAPAAAEDDGSDYEDSAVVVAGDDDFEEKVQLSGKDSMVEFYAPWCGHCQQLKPEYKAAAKKLADAGVETAQFVAVDSTVHEKITAEAEIQGYPTLFFVPGGDMSQKVSYEGARDAAAMVDFMKAHATAPF